MLNSYNACHHSIHILTIDDLIFFSSAGSKPEILDKFRDLTILSPKEAVFECRVNLGEPQAKVRCFRDDKEVFSGSKYVVIIRGDEIRLVVRDTEPSDAGTYRLEASNKLGSVKTEAKLNINSQYFAFLFFPINFNFI
jgi:hypothetical protein